MKKEKLNDAQRQMLAALREFQLTPEEERIMDEFEEFQRQHPINFSSLDLESIDDEERQAAIRSVALETAARRLKDDD
jgi:hypothetical protein